MPIGRIRNVDIPIARLRNVDLPLGRIKYGTDVLTAGVDTIVTAGTPIGLLLALTYATQFTVSSAATYKELVPIARIRNTD